MRMILRLILIIISFSYISGYSLAQENKIYEQCFINKVKDNKTGYSYIVEKENILPSGKIISTKKYTEIEFQKYGLPIKMISDIEYVETPDGKPISISATIESLDKATSYNAKFLDNNKIELEIETKNDLITQIIEYQGEILLPYAIGKLFKENTKKEIKYQSVDLSSEFRIVNITATKEKNEAISVNEKQIECEKYKVVADVLPNVGNYQWYDSLGHLKKEYSSILNIEQVAASKDSVMTQDAIKSVYYENLIPVDNGLKNLENVKQITYKIISSSNKNLDDIFIDNNKQEIIQSLDNTVYIKIKNDKNLEGKNKINEAQKYLSSSYFISSDRFEIQEVVEKFAMREKDKYNLAKSFENWVYENIKTEPFKSILDPSYRTVLELKGSPAESNLVLVSLLRAVDIPSRAILGLKYIETPQNAFGFYIWAEAFIDGKWHRFDAITPKFADAPIYIAIKEVDASSKKQMSELILGYINSFSNYKIHILNVAKDTLANQDSNNEKTQSVKKEFNFLDILRTGDKYITELKNEEKEASKKKELQKEDYLNKGFLAVSKGEFDEGLGFFKKASGMYSYGDDFNNMNYAIQMASLGLFSISKEYINQIYDTEIWQKQIETLKNLYFPKASGESKEGLYLKALASLRFNNEKFDIEKTFNSKIYKKDETAQLILGLNYYKNNEFKLASKAFKKASKINKDNLSYKLKLADSLIKENKAKKSLKVIKKLENKEIADKYFNIEIKKLKYLALSKYNKKSDEKRYYLALYHLLYGEDKKAMELLSKSIEEGYHHSNTYSLIGSLNLEEGKLNEAEVFSQKALTLDDKNVDALILKGDIEYLKGLSKEALRTYRKALNIKCTNEKALFKTAMILKDDLKDYMAINALEKIKSYKATDEVYYNLAELYLILGDKENAIENFKKTLALNPLNEKAWFRLAEIYLKDKNTFIAKNYLKPLEKINPNYKYYYYMGVIEKLNENHTQAKIYFEKSIELNSSSKAKEEL